MRQPFNVGRASIIVANMCAQKCDVQRVRVFRGTQQASGHAGNSWLIFFSFFLVWVYSLFWKHMRQGLSEDSQT